MLTLKCVKCGEVFTAPENPDRPLADVPRSYLDLPSAGQPVAHRHVAFRRALTVG